MEENSEGLAILPYEDRPELADFGMTEEAASTLNAGPYKCIALTSRLRCCGESSRRVVLTIAFEVLARASRP